MVLLSQTKIYLDGRQDVPYRRPYRIRYCGGPQLRYCLYSTISLTNMEKVRLRSNKEQQFERLVHALIGIMKITGRSREKKEGLVAERCLATSGNGSGSWATLGWQGYVLSRVCSRHLLQNLWRIEQVSRARYLP